ncbi:ammonium transporter Rh type A-like isoform X2 [Lytechinus variegatus]|uniref:ammonium transporter Rh type A-like isoform X2 n=1 Tax=Lytechinus variegatus TaxID=7654 RepID=UPI001BB11BB2|nr:ammonium transporter Rh type A-like isoform X2 [Lytechinus variegatus]
MGFFRGKLTTFLVLFEVLFIILFAVLVRYDDVASPGAADGEGYYSVDRYYPYFQDVHVMMFVGFGFLMTFLKRYGYSSIGINFLLAAFVIQWATLFRGFTELGHSDDGKIHVNIQSMLLADFTSATILISFGAVLGKTSPLQLILMAFFEVIFSLVNEFIAVEYLGTTDIGGSMYVHTFGAYFGLAVSLLVTRQAGRESPKEGAVYHSDLFAMIGTLFLWIFWPSFNSALGDDDQRHRAVLNTYFSLAACCVTTFAISSLLSKKGKFDMVHVQNATLAGGVAVGTAANLMIQPWGAILIGVVAGVLSTFGYKVIQPFLCEKFGLHDTCGVHNLHGMPGILGGLGGIVACALASEAVYGNSLPDVFGDRFEDPPADSTAIAPIEVRDAGQQALMQLAALVMTLAIAIVSGLFTGLILRCVPGLDALSDEKVFEDEYFWEEVEAEEGAPHPETYTKNGKQEGEAQV